MKASARYAGILSITLAVWLALSGVAAAAGNDVADFYAGKRIRLVVGYGPGGGFDTLARIVARHLSKYIPGNPSVVVENRPGAGSLIAANALYNTESKDGTVMATFTAGLVMNEAMGEPVRFDARKFNWLAAGEDSFSACVVRTDLGVRSIDDAKEIPVVMASQGPGNFTYAVPLFLNAMLGTQFKVIAGYQSVPDMFLAVQNKEASGICIGYVPVILATQRSLLEGSSPVLKPLVVLGDKTPKEPFLDGVPATEPLMKTEEGRQLFRTLHLPEKITFPYVMPPDVPKDRVEALRTAFIKLFQDPVFMEEAKKASHNLTPSTGAEVAAVVDAILSTPKPIIDQLTPILKTK